VATKSISPAVLLLALLAGCGGGTPDAAPTADPAAGLEEGEAKPAQSSAAAPAPATRRIDESLIPEPGQPIVRETYAYVGGPRDPFESALDRASAGPEFPDLELVALYYIARAPSTSVAVLRDRLNGKKYTVREGDRLGRMRIASIRPKDVTFTIDDYGTERQESLSIRKPEGNSP
jgi:hypothetical protein